MNCKSCLGQPGRRILDLKRSDFYWFIDFIFNEFCKTSNQTDTELVVNDRLKYLVCD
jgi:hypothetical protein